MSEFLSVIQFYVSILSTLLVLGSALYKFSYLYNFLLNKTHIILTLTSTLQCLLTFAYFILYYVKFSWRGLLFQKR